MTGPILSELSGIENARVKLHWAKHHLKLLNDNVTAWLHTQPYKVWTEDDLNAGEYRITLDTPPVPIDLTLHFGDFISNLRSSLDHLAGELTKVVGGTPNLKASFPIIAQDDKDGKALFGRSTKGVTPKAVLDIDFFQPYRRGDAYETSKLWQLNRLWNIDKHRRVPFYGIANQIQIFYPSDVIPISSGLNNSGVAVFRLCDKEKIELGPSINILIQFGDEQEGIIIGAPDVIAMYEFVRDEVFPKFEKFF